MTKVYIANFGEGNVLWPIAKANDAIVTIDNMAVHPFWQAGDRERFITTAMERTLTARGERPTRPTAGRWYNLMDEIRDSEGDLWISRQGEALWWSTALPGALRQSIVASTNPSRDGPEVWLLEKPCEPWSESEGRPLRWAAIHPKARDFLATEATFQTIANDRG